MPAGVPMKEYLKFMTAAMLSMFAGSQLVHTYYNPLKDLNYYVEKEIKTQRLREVKQPAVEAINNVE
ncbi:ubiquinol-cytochrome-c reductase complex assembly factor 6 [Toxorhynchites rutilus septentrionalis]|uniref:ubiquinol-cytochrome-c reductase complex assembly factor 6 n=1 Tax=Toxorhynchites rutilus septentrionalis TaxID=329112 RepID=UPI00247AEBF5|nr:ubiquinol-cytochrome-c reductase complex assembly factor 6 [Toxorhynchites rutilus septentrionalis]